MIAAEMLHGMHEAVGGEGGVGATQQTVSHGDGHDAIVGGFHERIEEGEIVVLSGVELVDGADGVAGDGSEDGRFFHVVWVLSLEFELEAFALEFVVVRLVETEEFGRAVGGGP